MINIKKKGINIDKLTPNEIYNILWRDYNWTDKFTLLEVLYMQYKLLWDIDRDFFFKEFLEKGIDQGFLSAYYFHETSREVRIKEIIKRFNIPITKSLTDYKRGGVLEEIDEFLENNIKLLENNKAFVFKIIKTTLIEVEISSHMLDNIFTRLRSIDSWSPSKWRKFSSKKWEEIEKELMLKSGKLKSRTFLISQKEESLKQDQEYLKKVKKDLKKITKIRELEKYWGDILEEGQETDDLGIGKHYDIDAIYEELVEIIKNTYKELGGKDFKKFNDRAGKRFI